MRHAGTKPGIFPAIFLLSIILLFITTFCSHAAAPVETLEQTIDAFISGEMNAGNIPGLSVGIVKGDKIVYLKGFGAAGRGREGVTQDTPFLIGSVSKTFTGLAVMKLMEDGCLNMDDPVTKFLPWFASASSSPEPILIRQLLNHTSGIPASAGHDSGIEKGKTIEEYIRLKSPITLHHAPGTTFEYSCLNYTILGAVIEAASGLSYDRFMRENIFEPMEMNNSYASIDLALNGGLSGGFRPWFGLQVPAAIKYSDTALPSSYIASSAEDMCHLLIAELNGGRFKGGSFLSEKGVDATQESIGQTGYAMGWFSQGIYKRHTGELADYNAYLIIVPSEKLGIVTLSNTNDIGTKFFFPGSSSLRRIPEGLRDFMLGGDLPDRRFWSVRAVYWVIDGLLVVLTILMMLFIKSGFKRKKPGACGFIATLLAAAAAVLILIFSPRIMKGSWAAYLVSIPDLTGALLLLVVAFLLASLLRLVHRVGRRFTGQTKRVHGRV